MRAKSIKGQSLAEVQHSLREATSDGFKPTLAIVFMSVKQDIDALRRTLDEDSVAIFGATSAGEFTDGTLCEGAIVILLMDLDPSCFRVLFTDTGETGARDAACGLAKQATEAFDHPAFVVAGSGLKVDGEQIIKGIEDAAGSEVSIWGGMAGDDYIGVTTWVFSNHLSSDQGIVILALDVDRVELVGQATSGWKGAGTIKEITRSEGMWVHTIDEKPALDQFTKYLGFVVDEEENIVDQLSASGFNSFLLLKKKGDPVVRTFLSVDQDAGAIMTTAHMEPGSKIQFAMPQEFEAIDEVIQGFTRIRDDGFTQAEALIMFSCGGRFYHFGPLAGNEIQALKDTFDAPLAGFFTYGEFGRAHEGSNEFHNFTYCWVGLKEKQPDQQ